MKETALGHDLRAQYCDDDENEDMFILINTMNNNKGINHTEE